MERERKRRKSESGRPFRTNHTQSLSRSSWPVFRSQWPGSFSKRWQIQTNLLSGELKKEEDRREAADGLLSALIGFTETPESSRTKTKQEMTQRVSSTKMNYFWWEMKTWSWSLSGWNVKTENQQLQTLKGGRVSLGFDLNHLLKVSEELTQALLNCRGLFTSA